MYGTSLTHLGNLSGNMDDTNSTYGAEFTTAKEITPYYERMIHYTDQKPWKNQNIDKTYMNYYKRMNEPKVESYKELNFTPISQDNYEFVKNMGDYNFDDYNNSYINSYNETIENFESTSIESYGDIKDKVIENLNRYDYNLLKDKLESQNIQPIDKTNKNPYFKALFIIFVLFVVYKLVFIK